jgi:23S rRNA C2498 (ribose-2'-O)-methylase RlmM
MSAKSYDLHGVRILECAAEGPALRNNQDAMQLILEAMENAAALIVIPTSRLAPDFFLLQTRLAGELLQKFVNYQRRVAIVGNFSEFVSNSASLRAFIAESNRGKTLWFLADIGELEKRLVQEERSPS